MTVFFCILSFLLGLGIGVVSAGVIFVLEDENEDQPKAEELLTIDNDLQRVSWGDWSDKP